jgi:hypothetical protein
MPKKHLLDDREGLGIPFSSATEAFDTASPMGRAMLGMLSKWAALESDLARERTRDALEAVRERGTKLDAPGMVERVGPDGTRDIDPAKVEVVRRIQARYAAGGWSHRRLAEALNAEGVPTLGPKPGARRHATTARIAQATGPETPARRAASDEAPGRATAERSRPSGGRKGGPTMDRVGPKAFTDVSYPPTPPLDAAAATQSTQAAGPLMSAPKPLACTQDDDGPMMSVADSPTAQMLRQQQAAAAFQGARQTGAEGTGQGDGPSGRPELTAEQAEEQKKVAKERAEVALEAGGGLLGSFEGGVGTVLGGVFGKYLSKEADNIKLPTAQENGGTAGASSTNPLDRAWGERLAARSARREMP